MPEVELVSHLSELKDSELLYERGIYPDSTLIFKHALTQEAAYNSLLQRRRKEIHAAVGKAIEELYPERLEEYCNLLAYQYAQSDDANKALEYLDRANVKALKLCAMEEARAYFDEAWKLLDTLPENEANRRLRVSLLVRQWIVFLLLLRFPEYYDLLIKYEPMATELKDEGLLGGFYADKGHYEWLFGEFEQAIETETKAAELCEAAGDFDNGGHAYMMLQWSHFCKGNFDKTLAFKDDVLRMIAHHSNLRTYVWSLCSAVWASSLLGHWDDALEDGKKALSVAQEYSDNSLISFAAWHTALTCTYKGALKEALEHSEMAVECSPSLGDKMMAQNQLAWTLCRVGEPQKSIEILTATIPLFRATRFIYAINLYLLYLGESYWFAREYEKASRTLEEGMELARRCGIRHLLGWAERLMGEIALRTNLPQTEEPLAAPHFENSIAISK